MPNEFMPYQFNYFRRPLFIVMIWVCLLLKIECFNFKQLGRNAVSRIINERTSYSFVFDRMTDNNGVTTAWNTEIVPANGNVSVQFPSQYVLTGTETCNSITIVTGISTIQSLSPTGYSCAVQGNRLIFTGALSSLSDLHIRNITVNYGNILNPSPAFKTGEFTGYLGNDIAVPNGNTFIQLSPATFSSCYITFGNGSFVNQTSPAIFNFTLLNQLNSSSSVRVNFPSITKTWTNDISQTILPIQSGPMSCTGHANALTNPICTGNYAAFTVSATSIFSSVVSSGQKVSFQINNFLSPPTLQPSDSIKITTLTNGFQVDTCTTTVSDLKPKQFTSLNIGPIDQMLVNQNVGIKINMTFSDTIDQNDAFRVTFPGSLGVIYTSISTSGSSQGLSSLNGQILSVNQNVNFQVTYFQDYFLVINFYTMTAPSSIKQSEPILVQVLRNGYQKMIGSGTVKARQSVIDCSVSPQSLLVNAQTLYTFNIKLNDKLSADGWLQIYFPSNIPVDGNVTIASATGTNIRSNPSVSVDEIQRKITVTSLNSSTSNINAQTFSLTLGTIRNPGTTKPTGQFSIKSYYQSGIDYLVAVGTFNGITPTPGVLKISDISITKSSDIVLASPIDYTVSFVSSYPIPQNGIIKVQIPDDIKIDLNNIGTNCFQTVNGSGLISATCSAILNSSTKKYQITLASISLNGNLPGNTSISILLQGICTNPDTTRNILGFSINIYSADNYLIQGANSGISTRANTPAQCLNVVVNRASQKNSDITNYTISLKQPSNLSPQSYLVITLPTKLELTNITDCVDLAGTLTLSCSISGNTITVLFSAQSVGNMTLFGVILTNIVNTASYQPLNDNFTLLTKTPDNLNRYCQFNNPFLFQNNIPSSFSSINGAFTPRIFNELTSLIMDLKPSSRLIPSYVIVSVATELTVDSLTCSFQGIVGGVCTSLATNTIRVSGSFTGSMMQFTLGGIRAPKFSPSVSQFSSVSSFTTNNYKIDDAVNLVTFEVKCTLPCKTCSDTNLTECLSCYQDITISTSIYHLNALKTCYSTCPDGYFADVSTLTCDACNAICNTCMGTSTNCTSCKNNSTEKYFYMTSPDTGTCFSSCPTYFYADLSNKCIPCESPCNDCTSKTVCVTCASPFYMFNDSCVSSCPSGTTIPNDATRNCDLCSSICATCSGNVNNCVTCSADAAFFNGTCTSTCPPPLVINAGQCAGCDPICKQCSLRASNCTKCDTSSSFPYFYNFTCLSDCPSTYYKDLLNGVCLLCSDLNIGCRFCSSASTCISCDAGFIFLNNKCYNNTPNGYYNQNGNAMPCSGDCATCIDFATKCTSCKTLNLDGNDCVSSCPSTKVPVNKVCTLCQTPCLTCSNIPTNCTACIPNLNPKVFLNNYYCAQTCPDYTYPDEITSTCAPCQSPCLKCTSFSSCLSCVNGKFLLGTTCQDSCPNGYIGINRICEPCTFPCMTCQITQTRCLSCSETYYLYNSSSPTCIQDCSTVNLYPNPLLQICAGCQAPCVTCSTTSTSCTSCQQSMILFNNTCISQCPSGYYQSSSSCQPCPTQCATCTSPTICQSCTFPFYFLLNYCVDVCPSQYPVISLDGRCQKCTDINCKVCAQNDYCQQCMQPFFLHLGNCVQRCPTDYNETIISASNFRECIYDPKVPNPPLNNTENTTETNIAQTLKSGGDLFPVPLIIVSAFIGVATIMSKFQNSFTFISGVLYSLWSLTQWAAVALMLWFFYQSYGWNHVQFYILAGSFAFLYLLNIFSLLVQNIYLLGDSNFNKWLVMGNNKCFYYFVSLVSFLTTHKFKNFIFSKMFNFVFLKAKLDSIQQFRVFYVFSFLSLLSSAGILFGMGLVFTTYQQSVDQKLMFFIDATVLTAINVILAILNSRKDAQFFEQKNEDGFVVHKRIEDYDEFLYGGMVPFETEQKFDQFETTGKKLMSTPYETKYRKLESDVSEESVRGVSISIQAQQILGSQSMITHLEEEGMSDLDIFERKQVSVQFDQERVQVQDRSVSMMVIRNHEVSVQMDNISQNEISVQVERQNHEISIQFAPNQMDHSIGMSRQQANISIQANPMQEQISIQYGPEQMDHSIGMSRQEADISIQANPIHNQISVQYSNKPMFVDVDHQYETGNDAQNDLQQIQHQSQHSEYISKTIESERSLIQNQHQQQNGQDEKQSVTRNNQNKSHLTTRIKKPDGLLKPELQFDINEKLMKRQAELERLQQERQNQQRLKIIQDFKKKLAAQQKPINYQLSKVIQQAFVPMPKQPILQDKQSQLVQQQIKQPISQYEQSGTIMDSKYDLLVHQQQKEFSSNQSRVQSKYQGQNQNDDHSIGGEKSQQEFIQMLSGKKVITSQNDQSYLSNKQYFKIDQSLQKNKIFVKNQFKVLDINYVEDQLGDSDQISLNMTDQHQQNQQTYSSHQEAENEHQVQDHDYKIQNNDQVSQNNSIQIQNNKNRINFGLNVKFEKKDKILDMGSENQLEQQQEEDDKKREFSKQESKSISTKNMTRINTNKPMLNAKQENKPIDTSNEIEDSFSSSNDLTRHIINAPIHIFVQNQQQINSSPQKVIFSKQSSLKIDSFLNDESKPNYFTQSPIRNLKSATIIRNYPAQQIIHKHSDDSIDNQHLDHTLYQKQQPLPLPSDEIQKINGNQIQQLQFGESQKVFVSPLNSQQILNVQIQNQELPEGIKTKFSRLNSKKKTLPKNHDRSNSNFNRYPQKKMSRSREKPIQNELLNPSTSIKNRKIAKELQKQQRKVQSRKKNLQLMQGMLERPSQLEKKFGKDEEQERKRTAVEKIYLNRQNYI